MRTATATKATIVGILALASAIAIWIGMAVAVLQADAVSVPPSADWSFIALIGVGCVLDAIVAVRAWRGRLGLFGLGWLALRCLLSAVGFLWITLPSYAIAAIALTRRPAASTASDPNRPHAFRPASSGWFGSSLAPFQRTAELAGTRQFSASTCAVCGAAEGSPLHAPVTDAVGA
jgi:hypothetical protein